MNNKLDYLDGIYKHLLYGVIVGAKKPEIELEEENKIITLTFFKDTYIRVGFYTYYIYKDTSCFVKYEENDFIHITYNTNTQLFAGYSNSNIDIGEDNISVGVLLFRNGVLEYNSFFNDTVNTGNDLSIISNSNIAIDLISNSIMFPDSIDVIYSHKSMVIKNHPRLDMGDEDEVSLYYNPIINKFVVNPINTDSLNLVAIYHKNSDMIGLNKFPEVICVNIEDDPKYKIAKWYYNYDAKNKCIEWEDFYAVDTKTWGSKIVNRGKLVVEDENGNHVIVFNPNNFEIDILINPKWLPKNCIILDTFIYNNGDIEVLHNKVNGYLPLEDEVNKINKNIDENLISHDNGLVLPRKIYIVNNNPILKSSMTVSGYLQNQITVIDKDNNISYPCMEVELGEGINHIYSENDSKDVEVFKYSSNEVIKDYKFGFISNTSVHNKDILPLPGKVIFDYNNANSYEYLVGIDTSEGLSPFMRIAGTLDKEKYPAWCYRRTGSKNEISYSSSSDKSGDFYIFDLRYYLLSLELDDNDPLTHIIINASSKSDDSTLEAMKILYNIIHDTYPNINIGLVPMLCHGSRNTNTSIMNNKVACNFINKVINHMDYVDEIYKVSILPMWLYINPMVNNEIAMIHEAWNCIVGWACNTF